MNTSSKGKNVISLFCKSFSDLEFDSLLGDTPTAILIYIQVYSIPEYYC